MLMSRNLYLFILWQKGRVKEKEFLEDVQKRFQIFQIYEITWEKSDFARSLARFYGKKLPKGCKKEQETGNGPFLVVLFYDPNEDFNSSGNNRTVMIAKAMYRYQLGGNFLHASDSPTETNENALFLFGKNCDDLLNESPSLSPISLEKNITGFPYWKDLEQALFFVRKCPDTSVVFLKKTPIIRTAHFDMLKRLLNAKHSWWFNKYKIRTAFGYRSLFIKKTATPPSKF